MSLRKLTSLLGFSLGFALLAALPGTARADGAVIGDSLGVGVNFAARMHSLATNSVRIQGDQILAQIRQLKSGTTAFMSLGTNDAVGGAVDVKKAIDAIVATADAQGVKLVWIGPPCVIKPWNSYSRQIDGIVKARLQGTSAIFVSMQGADLCAATVHAKDGVHFTMAGYTSMWQKAAAAAGFASVTAVASDHKVAAKTGKKKKPARHRKTRHHSPAPKAAAPPPVPGAT